MNDNDLDKYSDAPLTPIEVREFRRMIEQEKRVIWFWATARTFAMWVTAVIAAVWAGQEFLTRLVKSLAK